MGGYLRRGGTSAADRLGAAAYRSPRDVGVRAGTLPPREGAQRVRGRTAGRRRAGGAIGDLVAGGHAVLRAAYGVRGAVQRRGPGTGRDAFGGAGGATPATE